ncbi:hypothetical protein VNO78_13771 [Psophocarpus tetragonolobus]|uniref:NB-ARC domain-containing protein n=1 Tax=Psophocarpus tetragonolobus TaxID=3891 RepID=A0AAN9SQH3_PSOTE
MRQNMTESDLMQPPPGFPLSSISLHAHEAKFLSSKRDLEFRSRVLFYECLNNGFILSDAAGFKGCREFEGPYVDYLADQFGKLVLLSGPVIPEPPNTVLDEIWDAWLGRFNDGSVIYCALGSEWTLPHHQFQQPLLGLELTGLPFLAVLKIPIGFETIEAALPEGFKERVEGRGILQCMDTAVIDFGTSISGPNSYRSTHPNSENRSSLGLKNNIMPLSRRLKALLVSFQTLTYGEWVPNIKVLIVVVDNVDQIEKLEKLGINPKVLSKGSRMIITTRDKHILEEFGAEVVHKVSLMNNNDARELFYRKAFKREEHSSSCVEVLEYVGGLPLAIREMGSLLCTQWRDASHRSKTNPNVKIMNVIQLSVDELENEEKEIFLHFARFFNGEREDYVKPILECKSEEQGGDNVKAIVLNKKEDISECKDDGLSKMKNLRLFILIITFQEGYFFPRSYGIFLWHGYPFDSLPSNFRAVNLVELNMPNSSIKRVWDGLKSPDFSEIPKFERLDFSVCTGLVHVHPSIELLEKHAFLSFRNCSCLVTVHFNSKSNLISLRVLHLAGCTTNLDTTPNFNKCHRS